MKRHFWHDSLILSIILVSFLGFLLYTGEVRESVGEALALCAGVLIPSLFPCMVIATFLIESGASLAVGRVFDRGMRFLFGVPGECVTSLLPGFAAGYPVGARTAIALYKRGRCSREETERLLAFSNNSGPAFIFGTVGMSLFSSGWAGGILYISHILASIAVGILFRFWKQGAIPSRMVMREEEEVPSIALAFTKSVKESALSILHVTAFVTFFSAAVRVLFESGLIPTLADWVMAITGIPAIRVENLLVGLLEMTGGLSRISSDGRTLESALVMAAFLLGWAGFSIHFQVLSFLGESRLSMLPYFGGKLLHGGISAILVMIFSRWFPVSETVALTQSIRGTLGQTGWGLFFLSFSASVVLSGIFLLIARITKKSL